MKKLKNFIGGELCEPQAKKYFESFNPSLGEPHLLVPDSDAKDIDLAVEAASLAFPRWSGLTAQERSNYLCRIADLVDERSNELAEAESADQGKPVWLAKEMDIARVAYNFRFFAGAILHQEDLATVMNHNSFNYVVRQPVGVAGLISPWNLPLYLLSWKIAPAIAFGNTCVAKPSEITSLTAAIFSEIVIAAGLPKGVINIVFGAGPKAGAALVDHPKVPIISFTGGTATGKIIAQAAAGSFKKVSLELGGKNPNIIFDDADLDLAVETTIRSSFLNQGEICLCGSRIYVHEKVFGAFLDKFVSQAKELKIGDPRLPATFIGPVASKEHHVKVLDFLKLAREEKLKILCGGGQPQLEGAFAKGYFIEPTIIVGAKQSSRLNQEEIFGPVVTVTPFKTDDEALELANGVRYGLSASVWTKDLSRAHGFAQKIQAGTVWVNSWMKRDLRVPFGGIKASGVGREGQEASLEFFTESKTISVRHS